MVVYSVLHDERNSRVCIEFDKSGAGRLAVYLSIAARRSGESALFVRRVAVVKVRMIAFH